MPEHQNSIDKKGSDRPQSDPGPSTRGGWGTHTRLPLLPIVRTGPLGSNFVILGLLRGSGRPRGRVRRGGSGRCPGASWSSGHTRLDPVESPHAPERVGKAFEGPKKLDSKLPLHGGPNMPVLATFGGGGVPRNRQSSRKRPAETRHGCIRWIWYRGGRTRLWGAKNM